MSADNFIGILELIDKDDHREYRVADNVSASYCLLDPDVDLSVHWQGPMVFNIWNEARVFSHILDAIEYSNELEEDGFYEYGTSTFSVKGNWDDVVKAHKDNICEKCNGSGDSSETEVFNPCEDCNGSGLHRGFPLN